MSAVLLDTNAFAMALTNDPRLTALARRTMLEASQAVVSAISLYEIGQKVRLGKWPEMEPFAAGLADQATRDGFHLSPLTAQVAQTAGLLDWAHRDPFDRFIAAQALNDDLPVVSSDAAFDALDLTRIW